MLIKWCYQCHFDHLGWCQSPMSTLFARIWKDIIAAVFTWYSFTGWFQAPPMSTLIPAFAKAEHSFSWFFPPVHSYDYTMIILWSDHSDSDLSFSSDCTGQHSSLYLRLKVRFVWTQRWKSKIPGSREGAECEYNQEQQRTTTTVNNNNNINTDNSEHLATKGEAATGARYPVVAPRKVTITPPHFCCWCHQHDHWCHQNDHWCHQNYHWCHQNDHCFQQNYNWWQNYVHQQNSLKAHWQWGMERGNSRWKVDHHNLRLHDQKEDSYHDNNGKDDHLPLAYIPCSNNSSTSLRRHLYICTVVHTFINLKLKAIINFNLRMWIHFNWETVRVFLLPPVNLTLVKCQSKHHKTS